MEAEEGGTKIRRPPRQQPIQPQSMPQLPSDQQYQPQQIMPQQQQRPSAQDLYQQQQAPQQQPRPPAPFEMPFKEKFSTNGISKSIKYSVLVMLIFILLNSKLVWKQLIKLPFMGTVEPSIIALIVNSIIAGIVFFIITKYI
jgi:hypothetical protein